MSDETETPEETDVKATEENEGGKAQETEAGSEEENESLTLSELDDTSGSEANEENVSVTDLDAVYGIPVEVTAVLGKSNMPVSSLLKLGRGAVIELDRKVGEAIDIYVNNRLVARGEVVVVEDKLGITMTEIIKADRT